MPKLFLDANVLFTAAYSSGGRAAALVDLARHGKCELITSPHALAEARRNLRLKRPDALESLERDVTPHVGIVSEAKPGALRIGLEHGLPLKDAPILGAALQAEADMLLTGDARHFGHLYGEKVMGVKIVAPVTALMEILK